MVNINSGETSTKAVLLGRLRQLAGEPVSGERLAAEADVSRVAVWKAADALRHAGYAITSDEKGYRLDPGSPDDFLYPWEFSQRGWRFRHWPETDSTMDRIRELADRGAPSGTVAVAERQRAGRGRSGRTWSSEDGGLFFTLLLPGGAPIQRYSQTGMQVQIGVAKAIRRIVGAEARLRWPNDVYIGDRKVAGVLTELRGEGDRVRWISVGVGINVNNAPPSERATSCAEAAGHFLSRRALLEAVLAELSEPEMIAERRSDFAGEWNEFADFLNATVGVIDATHGDQRRGYEGISGRFLGIDAYGRAVLATGTGIATYEAGAASLRPDPDR